MKKNCASSWLFTKINPDFVLSKITAMIDIASAIKKYINVAVDAVPWKLLLSEEKS
jgi:hypothetical protein